MRIYSDSKGIQWRVESKEVIRLKFWKDYSDCYVELGKELGGSLIFQMLVRKGSKGNSCPLQWSVDRTNLESSLTFFSIFEDEHFLWPWNSTAGPYYRQILTHFYLKTHTNIFRTILIKQTQPKCSSTIHWINKSCYMLTL